MEFAVENNKSLSRVEEDTRKGAKRILLKEVMLWINSYMVEYGFLPLDLIRMDE